MCWHSAGGAAGCPGPMAWADAEAWCRALGARLPTMEEIFGFHCLMFGEWTLRLPPLYDSQRKLLHHQQNQILPHFDYFPYLLCTDPNQLSPITISLVLQL